MFCTNCGNQLPDGALFCTECGTKIEAAPEQIKKEEAFKETPVENTPVEAPAEEPKAEEPKAEEPKAEEPKVEEPKAEAPKAEEPKIIINNTVEAPRTARPVYPLPDKRSWWKCLLLGIITLGIYNFVITVKMSEEINIVASRYDGERTTHFAFVSLLSVITLGIYPIVWWHGLCNRLGREVRRRGYDYSFGASVYWLWGVLGSLILVGPFIYAHKLTKTMNLINRSYNYYG